MEKSIESNIEGASCMTPVVGIMVVAVTALVIGFTTGQKKSRKSVKK
jgi:hypothetical protein